jgi:peroxiredoxin Q/BCP
MSRTAAKPRPRPGAKRRPTGRRSSRPLLVLVAVVVAIAATVALYATYRSSRHAATAGGQYQVGSPGPGQPAPSIVLPATTGGRVDLAGYRGKTVLLYFQEGVGCQPCWTQMRDLEKSADQVRAAGVDQILSITTQPVDLLKQKATDEGLHTPVLSDTTLAVSRSYHANDYGMMGDMMDGHTFVLVGPDGVIRWRGDYGGAPRYTMYVPVPTLLTDLRSASKNQ